jgi:hypothetical protein
VLQVRTLLGRHYFCSELGNLTQQHLRHAQTTLSQYDAVMVLGQDALDDAVRGTARACLPACTRAGLTPGCGTPAACSSQLRAPTSRMPHAPAAAGARSWARWCARRRLKEPPGSARLPALLLPQVLAHGLGWSNVSLGTVKRRVAAPYSWTKTFKAWAAAEEIRQANGMDQQLVDFAMLLTRLDGFFFNGTGLLQQRQQQQSPGSGDQSAWQHAQQELQRRVGRLQGADGENVTGDALELRRPHGLFAQYEGELLAATCGYVGVRSKAYYKPAGNKAPK